MKINFVFNIDTRSANPQEIIQTLPDHTRIITAGGYYIVNPETEEGYGHNRSQVKALMETSDQLMF